MTTNLKENKNENKAEFERIDFLKCRAYLNELGFTDQEINTALDALNITKRDLCDSTGFSSEPTYFKIKEFDRNGTVYYKEYKGAYYKECTTNGQYWLVPAQHQGLRHGKIIFELLKNRFYWFDSFNKVTIKKIKPEFNERTRLSDLSKDLYNLTLSEIIGMFDKEQEVKKIKSLWSLYEMNSAEYEFYLSTQYGSLYVPISAILNSDFDIVKTRMVDYFKWYETNKSKFKECIKPLKSKEAKKLQSFLSIKILPS